MPEVVALSSFEHNGKRRRGDQFAVSDAHALALSRAGLVMLAEESAPTKATGSPLTSSASPVALVLPEQTLSESESGGKRRGRPRKDE